MTVHIAPWPTLSGHVVYRERMALVPGATVRVELLDLSRVDAPLMLVAAQEYVTAGQQVPLPFQLIYATAAFDPAHTYTVSARVDLPDGPGWRSTERPSVLARDNPVEDVTIRVQRTGDA